MLIWLQFVCSEGESICVLIEVILMFLFHMMSLNKSHVQTETNNTLVRLSVLSDFLSEAHWFRLNT